MTESVDNNQESIIKEVVQQFIDARLQGEKPDIEGFVKQYPNLEHEIRESIQDAQRIDALFDSLAQADESDFVNIPMEHDLVGKKIGSFEIVEIIGRGGMGVVYLAHDIKLDRSVAIKSIPPELQASSNAQMRFQREAKLLASLNHPNIAVIHDIIEENKSGYLILEYVPGETLAEHIGREPLKLQEVLSISQQIAEAVSAAYEKSVVHRDLKPGNIKIMPDGRVKVLDFGLAKAPASEDKPAESTVTHPGRVMGTPAYMSPEQARGKDTDHRTDIWSFGCIVYQMLTGRLPFEGETATDTLARIIEHQPDWEILPKETPENIRTLLRQCLQKNQDERFADIGEAAIVIKETLTLPLTATATPAPARSLRRWTILIGFVMAAIVVLSTAVILKKGLWRQQLPGVPNPGLIESIAVLPLQNLSGDPNQEYFADAMTDELIACLGRIGALRVISRQSVMQYKESDKSLPEIARELNVDAVVEGTVLCDDEQVRITAQLIEGATDRHLWVDSYKRDLQDVLGLQSEVARTIARQINVMVTPAEQALLTSARPVNPEAYKLYRLGKHHYFNLTKEEIDIANEYFQQAIDIDPNYAQAYAGLAASYEYLAWAGYMPQDEAKSKTMALLSKALEIDNTLAEVHLALAGVRFVLYWDWAGGMREIKHAIEFNPNLAEAHYENAYYLMSMGRFDEAIVEARRAIQLDPLSYLYEGTLAYVYLYARQYKNAITQYKRMAELEPKRTKAYLGLARTYEKMGRYVDAVDAQKKILTLLGAPPEEFEALAGAYREDGPKGYWMWCLEKLKSRGEQDTYNLARIYAQLGDKEQAFACLEKAYEKHDGTIYTLKVEPLLDPLRDDPRFDDLLRRMNIPD